jgi:hypothetical protein
MSISSNSSDKQVIGGRLYTGITNMKVVAINPTKAKLEELGYRPQNEPVYVSEEDEVKKVRIDFLLACQGPNPDDTVKAKIAFFLENKERQNQEGTKAEWMNNFGRSAWGTPDGPPTALKWFNAEGARPAKVGESDLYNFILNWLNVNPNDEARLEHFDALFAGNYAELQGLLASNPNNEVRVLLTVKDGKYQSVYNKYFDRATSKRLDYWEKHIKGQTEAGYPPKDDFQASFAFQEWLAPTVDSSDNGNEDTSDNKEESPF